MSVSARSPIALPAAPRALLLLSGIGAVAACGRDDKLAIYNAAPKAEITAPADGTAVLAGTPLSLRGAASDDNDAASELSARWFVDDAEACAAATPAADGTTTCEVTVPDADTVSLRLEVVDPSGEAGTDTVTLPITPNAAPTATIDSPLADGVYYSDQLITFRGTLADAEDDAASLTAWWEDGATRLDAVDTTVTSNGEVLGYTTLTEGAHALELHVQDSTGNEGIQTVLIDVGPPNSAPDCAITAPVSGGASEDGERVDFTAQVSDPDIAANLLSIAWTSDKDGPLGTSTADSSGAVSFHLSNLSAADHRITMTVTDEVGATCAAAIDWTVGTPPSIVLETPVADELVNAGDTLAFSAYVADAEDVASALTVTWSSSIDGVFYEGPPDSSGLAQFLDSALSVGDHVLTVTVTDSDGLYASALGTFTVNGLPTAPGVSISPAGPSTTDDLRVAIDTASVDPEGDALTYAYAWSVDGVASLASTSAALPASATTRGEVWRVDVTASDGYGASPAGSASVTIANSAPTVSVALSPASVGTNDTLTATATSADDDGDALTTTYDWYVDGALVQSGASATLSGASWFSVGQEVYVVATVSDGTASASATSGGVVVVNAAPVISSVTLTPSTVYTNDTLTASVVSSDADGDTLSLSYDWYVDGVLKQSGSSSSLSGALYFSKGQAVYVTVSASDGTTSTSATSSSVTVSNTAPTAPVVEVTPATYAELGSTSAYADLNQPYMYADVVRADRDGELSTFGIYAAASSCSSVDFFVLSSATAATGTWTLEWSGPGSFSAAAGYQSAGTVEVPVTAGRYYAFGWATTCSSGVRFYYGVSGLPTDAGFGEAVGYFGQTYSGASSLTGTVNYNSVYAAPEAMDVSFIPTDAESGDDLTCTVTAASTDADGDALTYSFAWDVDGVAYTGASDAAMDSVVPGADVGGGETWTCEVTSTDGSAATVATASLAVSVGCNEDGDGYESASCGGDDCDDGNAAVHPFAGDTYGDGVDGDCDGMDCEADHSGSVYFVACTEGVTYSEADLECKNAGYDGLASIQSTSESADVASLLARLPYAGTTYHDVEIWLGMNDSDAEGTWTWDDGAASSYRNWYVGEPAGGTAENCAIITDFTAYTWIDVPCTRPYYAPLCETR